jgi:hypothetical protein
MTWKVKDIGRYGKQWFELAKAFESGEIRELVVYGFRDMKSASRFRFKFYAFRSALQKEGEGDYKILDYVSVTIRYDKDKHEFFTRFDLIDEEESAVHLGSALDEALKEKK